MFRACFGASVELVSVMCWRCFWESLGNVLGNVVSMSWICLGFVWGDVCIICGISPK